MPIFTYKKIDKFVLANAIGIDPTLVSSSLLDNIGAVVIDTPITIAQQRVINRIIVNLGFVPEEFI